MRILVVDDESLIRKCFSRIGHARGHAVRTEQDGIAGLKAWRDFQPHLIFLDILMPGLDGPSVLKQAGKQNNEKVVMMSAHRAFSEGISIPGVDLFFSKPFKDITKVLEQAENLFNIENINENHLRPI